MKHTGFGSRIAAISRPLASSAVDGATTLIPGACMNHASGFCEWNGPPEKPPPPGRRPAHRRPDDPRLGQRRVHHPRGPELLDEAVGHLERPAEDPDVLAQDE